MDSNRRTSAYRLEDAKVAGIMSAGFTACGLWGLHDWRYSNFTTATHLNSAQMLGLLLGPLTLAFCLPQCLACLGVIYNDRKSADDWAFAVTFALFVPSGLWMAWVDHSATGKWFTFFVALGICSALLGVILTIVNVLGTLVDRQEQKDKYMRWKRHKQVKAKRRRGTRNRRENNKNSST